MKNQSGFTLIEMLVVAAIIGILLAIAIPNLLRARISSNEANARKAVQVLRDAEALYFIQDLDADGINNYSNIIGDLSTPGSLRCPLAPCDQANSIVDDTLERAVATGASAICNSSKAGYCFKFADDEIGSTDLDFDFGWKASAAAVNTTGRKDFAVYGDGTIRCSLSTNSTNTAGTFQADRNSPGCDD